MISGQAKKKGSRLLTKNLLLWKLPRTAIGRLNAVLDFIRHLRRHPVHGVVVTIEETVIGDGISPKTLPNGEDDEA